MAEPVLSGLVAALVAGVLALLAPRVIARLPEPREVADDPSADKERYPDLAALPRLGVRLALASALVGLVVGARLGAGPDLVLWLLLVPVLCTLAFVDWRTRYLPTRIIAPSYVVLVVLILLNAALPWGDGLTALKHAALGWLIIGGVYLVLWLVYPKGLGYGDVRLAGLIGLGLGHLGMAETVVGAYAGFLLGALGGLLLSRLGVFSRKSYPFGPFMVAGTFVAVLFGDQIMTALGY